MTTLAQLGGLAGLAALLTAIGGVIVQLRGLRRVRQDTIQLQPDHGTSVADAIARIEAGVIETRRLIGHEIGEVRDQQHADLIDVRARLRALENNRE